MKELKPRIHENGIDYILIGDYYVPDWKLPEEKRPVGHWGRLHQAYLRMYRPGLYSELVLSCKLHTYLADLNEQATERCSLIIEQMAEVEGVDEALKASDQMLWVQSMNSIRSRAEENTRKSPCCVTDWLAKFSKRHGLPHINPHAFRHTMASMLYFNGVDSVSISKRLGHAQVSTTANIYAHVMEAADKKNVDILADVFLKKA